MRIHAATLLALLVVAPGTVLGAATEWQEVAPGVRLRLIAGNVLEPDGTTLIGLEVDMPATTKTYWRVPGESGIPTEIDLASSNGVAGHEILWPYPTIDQSAGLVDFVYFGPMVLPVELRISAPRATVEAAVVMGVCWDICVPVTASFRLPLDFATPDRAHALRLDQAVALAPIAWDGTQPAVGAVSYDAQAAALAVRAGDPNVDLGSLIADTGPAGQLFGAPQKSPDGSLALLPLLGGSGGEALEGQPVNLTFMTRTGAYAIERRVTSGGSTAAGQ